MCSRPQFTDLTYMGGTRSCRPILPIFNTNQRMGNRSLCANSVALCVRTQSCLPQTDTQMVERTDGLTDRHSSNVLEFCADQMSPRNIRSQIIISMCYKRIDKTNLLSMRRV